MSSCYRCTEPFKFYRKEIGCGQCGFAFCSKCCKSKVAVPKRDNKIVAVCDKCFGQLRGSVSSSSSSSSSAPEVAAASTSPIVPTERPFSPPQNLLKLMECNNTKRGQQNQSNQAQKHQQPVANEDELLAQRLAKLTDKDNKSTTARYVPSDSEIEQRLRQLQGRSQLQGSLDNALPSKLPTRDVVNTADDLIDKVLDEVDIEKKHGDFERAELERLKARLNRLKAGNDETQPTPTDTEATAKTSKAASVADAGAPPDTTDELMKRILSQAETTYQRRNRTTEDEVRVFSVVC